MAAVLDQSPPRPFGTAFAGVVASASCRDGVWEGATLGPLEPLSLHPATHALRGCAEAHPRRILQRKHYLPFSTFQVVSTFPSEVPVSSYSV